MYVLLLLPSPCAKSDALPLQLIEQSFWSDMFSNDSEMIFTSPITRYHLFQSAGRRAFAQHGYKLTGM